MIRKLLPAAVLALVFTSVHAEIREQEVSYDVDDREYVGYFAWDDALDETAPGVLVVHEWWGHNDYARKRARMLAGEGYVALALDMYGKGRTADHPEDAQKFMQALMNDLDAAAKRFDKAHRLLDAHPAADPDRTAAIGYCMGGGVVLQMARFGKDLDAVVSFHGSLGTERPAKPGAVDTPMLVLTGGSDPFIPEEQIQAFREEMDSVDADYSIHIYPDAKHSFTNPDADENGKRFDLPLAYNAEADRDSWQRMLQFFEERLEE